MVLEHNRSQSSANSSTNLLFVPFVPSISLQVRLSLVLTERFSSSWFLPTRSPSSSSYYLRTYLYFLLTHLSPEYLKMSQFKSRFVIRGIFSAKMSLSELETYLISCPPDESGTSISTLAEETANNSCPVFPETAKHGCWWASRSFRRRRTIRQPLPVDNQFRSARKWGSRGPWRVARAKMADTRHTRAR